MQSSPSADRLAGECALPRSMIAGLWATVLALSLLFAPEVSDWIMHEPGISAERWALPLAGGLDRVSEWTRAKSFHDGVERLVSRLQARLSWPRESEVSREPRSAIRHAGTERLASTSQLSAAASPLLAEGVAQHRVLVIGESSIQFYLGSELERLLRSFYLDVEVMRFGKLATSLVRDDVLDWHEKTRVLVEQFQPDIVIANFGGNDAQGIELDRGVILDFGTARWNKEFAKRVSMLAGIVRDRGARLVMVGMPIMREGWLSKRMRHINAIMQSQMEEEGQIYVSSWEASSDENGDYKKAVTVDGVTGLMRLSDGKHYSRLGARFVADKIAEKLEQEFVLLPRDRALSVTFRRDIGSRALRQRASYLAYVPQQALGGSDRLPVLFLLHGAGGGFADWANHAHRKLQQLSSSYALIIVTAEGGSDGWYIDSPLVANSQYESHLVKEVIPDVDRHLPTNGKRAIGGLSAGGHGAITLALKHPDLFRSASSMSGVLDLAAAVDRAALIQRLGPYSAQQGLWEGNSARHLVAQYPDVARKMPMLISVGSNDRWAPVNRDFDEELTSLGVEHDYQERDGLHDWAYWTQELSSHVMWHADWLQASTTTAQ